MATTERVSLALGDSTRSALLRPGDSLLALARRLVPEELRGLGDPEPVDLSGKVAVFAMPGSPYVPGRVSLRAMTAGDLPWLLRWRNQAHVDRWWHHDPSDEAGVRAQYGPDLAPGTATDLWIAELRGRSVGFIQDYLIGDHPEYALLTGAPDARGCDYLIGEPAFVGRGVGTAMLWAWLIRLRDRHPAVSRAYAAPDHRNAASLRALAKVGFVEGLWFDEPEPDGTTSTVVGCTLDLDAILG